MTTPASVSGPRYRALLHLLRTAETVWNTSRVFFDRWEISPSQFNLLNLLSDRPDGCTQIELSRSLIMHRSNVTGLIDRLELRGLVLRQDSRHDRRAYRVALTAAGRRLIGEILPHYYAAAEKVWGGLAVGRVRELVADLEIVRTNAESMASEAKRPATTARL